MQGRGADGGSSSEEPAFAPTSKTRPNSGMGLEGDDMGSSFGGSFGGGEQLAGKSATEIKREMILRMVNGDLDQRRGLSHECESAGCCGDDTERAARYFFGGEEQLVEGSVGAVDRLVFPWSSS